MRKNLRFWTATVSAVLAAGVPLWAGRQEKTTEKPAVVAAKPGAAEMERLKFYLGEWDYMETYPNGGEDNRGAARNTGPGGNLGVETEEPTRSRGRFSVLDGDAR